MASTLRAGQMRLPRGSATVVVGPFLFRSRDDELKREGNRDQADADAKEKIRDAGDWAEDRVDHAR